MAQATILLLRHAEKPGVLTGAGVDPMGRADPSRLAVRGWQRAGALAALLAGATHPDLPAPARLYAAASTARSCRCEDTLAPLARKLGLVTDTSFTRGQEQALADQLTAGGQPALVCWKHEGLPALARCLVNVTLPIALPAEWPDTRYDLIWRLTQHAGQWRLEQFAQSLLGGDSDDALP